MALMVFVNDSWTLVKAPAWMVHFSTWQDGMSLADMVYPMFLFAMGMSIPYAIENRLGLFGSLGDVLKHVLGRTLALLVMGAFLYNSESGMSGNKSVFWLLMITGFFLVWNHYPKHFRFYRYLQGAGILLLSVLAIRFRSANGGLFQAGWWGILGQIGWAYFFAASAYLLCRKKPWALILVWVTLCLVNLSVVPMRDETLWIGRNFLADLAQALHLGQGHTAIMAVGGMLLAIRERRTPSVRIGTGWAIAALLLVCGYCSHLFWIVSKNLGSLPWCLYVSAISVALYTLFRLLETKNMTAWALPLKPAGTATLTTYVLPYLFYSIPGLFSLSYPVWLSGGAGAVKCALFSALCIATTALLGRFGLKLKV